MKHILSLALIVIIGGANLFGGTISNQEATYCDDGILLAAETGVTINYADKDDNTYRMALKHPNYSVSAHISDCACTAGSNVIGFYDRYDENLIPNHTAGTLFHGEYIYSGQDTYITDLVSQLYVDMGTDDEGTTVTEFKNGMIAFCNRKGKSISFSSCMTNSKFDYSKAKTYMRSNQPIVLFCSGYNIGTIETYDKSDIISYYESSANHVMVGFGYREISYQITASKIDSYQYITVASGVHLKSSGFYNISYNTKINDAYAVNIY